MNVQTQFSDELELQWNRILQQGPRTAPFDTYAWHNAWYETLGDSQTLAIGVSDTGILPLTIAGNTAHFSGGEEIADYLDALGPQESKKDAWNDMLTLLRQKNVSSLHLRNIPDSSATLDFFRTQPGAIVEQEDVTPVAALPATIDEYLSGLERKHRHEFRRKVRKFEEAYPNISFSVYRQDDARMSELFRLMKQDTDKHAFLTPAMESFFSKLPLITGDMYAQFSLAGKDDITIATTLAFLTDSSLLLYNSGYDHSYIGAGFYLKVKTVQWAIEHGITRYNFLQGSERYKYELGGKDASVYQVRMSL